MVSRVRLWLAQCAAVSVQGASPLTCAHSSFKRCIAAASTTCSSFRCSSSLSGSHSSSAEATWGSKSTAPCIAAAGPGHRLEGIRQATSAPTGLQQTDECGGGIGWAAGACRPSSNTVSPVALQRGMAVAVLRSSMAADALGLQMPLGTCCSGVFNGGGRGHFSGGSGSGSNAAAAAAGGGAAHAVAAFGGTVGMGAGWAAGARRQLATAAQGLADRSDPEEADEMLAEAADSAGVELRQPHAAADEFVDWDPLQGLLPPRHSKDDEEEGGGDEGEGCAARDDDMLLMQFEEVIAKRSCVCGGLGGHHPDPGMEPADPRAGPVNCLWRCSTSMQIILLRQHTSIPPCSSSPRSPIIPSATPIHRPCSPTRVQAVHTSVFPDSRAVVAGLERLWERHLATRPPPHFIRYVPGGSPLAGHLHMFTPEGPPSGSHHLSWGKH